MDPHYRSLKNTEIINKTAVTREHDLYGIFNEKRLDQLSDDVRHAVDFINRLAGELGFLDVMDEHLDEILAEMKLEDFPAEEVEILRRLGSEDPEGELLAIIIKVKSRTLQSKRYDELSVHQELNNVSARIEQLEGQFKHGDRETPAKKTLEMVQRARQDHYRRWPNRRGHRARDWSDSAPCPRSGRDDRGLGFGGGGDWNHLRRRGRITWRVKITIKTTRAISINKPLSGWRVALKLLALPRAQSLHPQAEPENVDWLARISACVINHRRWPPGSHIRIRLAPMRIPAKPPTNSGINPPGDSGDKSPTNSDIISPGGAGACWL